MFILPFIHIKKKSHSVIQIFLAKGGTALLTADDPAAFCKENDIPFSSIRQKDSIAFVNVIKEELQGEAFYSFHEEGAADLEVWKTFIWMGEKDTDLLNVNKQYSLYPTVSGHSPYTLLVDCMV
jgi:hypothetical protein